MKLKWRSFDFLFPLLPFPSFRPFKPSTTSNCQTCEQSGNVNFLHHPPKRNPADRVETNLILLLTLGIFLSDVQPSPPHVIPGIKKEEKIPV
jgi:hypothetical protein